MSLVQLRVDGLLGETFVRATAHDYSTVFDRRTCPVAWGTLSSFLTGTTGVMQGESSNSVHLEGISTDVIASCVRLLSLQYLLR